MYRFLAAAALLAALAGCSNTDDQAAPTPTASTVYQADVNTFCADVQDAITQDGQADPEDRAERLEELQQVAAELGQGARDDITAANALTACEKKLQDAINEG